MDEEKDRLVSIFLGKQTKKMVLICVGIIAVAVIIFLIISLIYSAKIQSLI
jgi:hypothetical protein